MKTNLTKKQASALCSKDDRKPVLKGLLYEPEKSRLTATTGHALISYKVTPDDGDNSAVIPPELFKTKQSDDCTYAINGSAVRTNGAETANYNLINENYPDYESVIPKPNPNSKFEIALNLDILKQLWEAVPKSDDGNRNIKLTFNTESSLKPVLFEQLSGKTINDGVEYSGVIMPVRMTD